MKVKCTALKRSENRSAIPVVMMSAHPSAKKSVELCGADGFIEKPFSLDVLFKEIQKHIN